VLLAGLNSGGGYYFSVTLLCEAQFALLRTSQLLAMTLLRFARNEGVFHSHSGTLLYETQIALLRTSQLLAMTSLKPPPPPKTGKPKKPSPENSAHHTHSYNKAAPQK